MTSPEWKLMYINYNDAIYSGLMMRFVRSCRFSTIYVLEKSFKDIILLQNLIILFCNLKTNL